MSQELAASVQTNYPQVRRSRKAFRIGPAWLPVTLIALVLLDIISPPGAPLSAATGALSYISKALMGIVIVAVGLRTLVITRLPVSFRIPVLVYILIVLGWFLLWIPTATATTAVTYLLNPTYSVWSWLTILLVPIIARYNSDGRLTNAVGRIPIVLGMVLVLVPALGIKLFGWNLNASNAAVAMLLILACRTRTGPLWPAIRMALAMVVAVAMILSGYRIYAVAALLFAVNGLVPKVRWLLGLQMVLLTLAPLIFQYVISNYSSYVVSQTDTYFQDTRSFLFTELINDFSWNELWTGRGLAASYYSPYFRYVASHVEGAAKLVGYSNINRTTSEIGWLNVILHFGLIGLIPFCMAVVASSLANVRRLTETIPSKGLYCFLPAMILLFAGELWNAFSAAYFSWYIALGAMLTAQPMNNQLDDSAN